MWTTLPQFLGEKRHGVRELCSGGGGGVQPWNSVAVSRVLGECLADSSRRLAFLGRLIRLAVKLPNSE